MTERLSYRLRSGGRISRAQPLNFTFDGRAYTGFEGDTLASSLMANGVRVVGRSFKYHRPRGILTAGNEEPNALVTLGTGARATPNTRATDIKLFDGLVANSQNRWPSLDFDLMAINQFAAPILIAGFYYKTFMWPKAFWEKLYEPLIRRAAGLGRLSLLPDPDRYEKAHAFCDLLIIGGGPAGLGAALAAGRRGVRVILADEDWLLGGRLLSERHLINGDNADEWLATTIGELKTLPNVTLLTRTSVVGMYDDEFAALERIEKLPLGDQASRPRQRLWKITPKRTIIASGAVERPLVFGGNDRPGVIMSSAASSYVNRFGIAPGKRVAVVSTTDSGWRAAEDLLKAGIAVTAIVDSRSNLPGRYLECARKAAVPVFSEAVVEEASGHPLRSITIKKSTGEKLVLKTDTLLMSGGWNPTIGIGSGLGAKPSWSEEPNAFLLSNPPSGVSLVGAASGQFSLGAALKSGLKCGQELATALGFAYAPVGMPTTSDDPSNVSAMWHFGHGGKAFVDFQNDVTTEDVEIALREGMTSIEHLKRYTTLGMGTDQGKSGQINAYALMAATLGKKVAEVGSILSRPPNVPVSIGAFAGHNRDEHFRPTRLTAGHQWAVEQGAHFVDTGDWKRAQWFVKDVRQDWLATVNQEVATTRTAVGVCDVSTLGKIEVHGRDAAALLDKLYINTMSTLKIGKTRYGIMLRDDGLVMDDGTVTRFGLTHYFVTTTTANAGKVMQHLNYCHQVLWPDLDVTAVSVTDQWSQYSIAGPHSRSLLQILFPEVDLTNSSFTHMSAMITHWKNIPARIYRVSFSGELAYEVGVPAHYGDEFIREIMKLGKPLDITPYGVEALSVMRIEKGHIGGGEMNGETTAADLGLGSMMSMNKKCIGQLMSRREYLLDSSRPVLVGIKAGDTGSSFNAGAHLLDLGAPRIASHDQGHVTSVAFSPGVGAWIGLALLKGGEQRMNQRLCAYDPVRRKDTEVIVTDRIFVDPKGERLRV